VFFIQKVHFVLVKKTCEGGEQGFLFSSSALLGILLPQTVVIFYLFDILFGIFFFTLSPNNKSEKNLSSS
jgi:hypothetical protein